MNTILITGANRGIGLELARQYAGGGWRVFACTRRPEESGELARLADEWGGAVSVHRLDVADKTDIENLARELREERIDILFNNAGVFGPTEQHLGPIDPEAWLQTFRTNVVAPYQVSFAFVEQVARSERKIIATMGSLMGSLEDNHSGGYYVYRSSKSAVAMVVRSLAADLHELGITTVVLHPGWVQTDMGGAGATLSPEESVAGLKKVLDTLTVAESGRFFNYDGRELPW